MNNQVPFRMGSDAYKQTLRRWAKLNAKSAFGALDEHEQLELVLLDDQLERAEL